MVNRIYGCNDDFFKEETEASFYWAGFIAADGCMVSGVPSVATTDTV